MPQPPSHLEPEPPEAEPEELGPEELGPEAPEALSRHGVSALMVLAGLLAWFGALLVANHWAAVPRDEAYVVRIELPPAGGAIGLPGVAGPLDPSRPLVVIDPGHGGHDPGARNGAWQEKDITLGLAWALRDALLAGGGVRVALTRGDDRYLALEERADIARRLKADLFIAIHADSASGAGADNAHGATLYTLSQAGSDAEASRIARSENAANEVNGVALGDSSGEIASILIDLSQRQSVSQARTLAALVLREGKGHLVFRDQPLQSAAFVVLKAPDVPSVLFEAGYISNHDDAARLASSAGRAAFATATARAIRIYFARQSETGAAASVP